MSYDDIQTAVVIRYPYLWARQARAGETEGRKDRPVTVGVRIARPEGDLVLFFPITSKQPEPSRFSVEIPDIEKRRAGLDADRRLWIILDEVLLSGAGAAARTLEQGLLPPVAARVYRPAQSIHRG